MSAVFCKPGCACKRHGCLPGCVCGRHQRSVRPEMRIADPEFVGKIAPYGTREYMRRHDRCRRERGDASLFPCERCWDYGIGEASDEWARIHTETGEDSWADYVSLCKSCHNKYDFLGRPKRASQNLRLTIGQGERGYRS